VDTGHGVIQRRDEPRLLRDCDDDDDVGQTDAQKNRRTDGRTDGQQTDILTPPVPLAAIQIFAFQLGAPMHRRAGGCAERTLAPVRLSFDEGRRLNQPREIIRSLLPAAHFKRRYFNILQNKTEHNMR